MTPDECDIELQKEMFDSLVRNGSFSVGPFREEPSREYGMPYIAPKHFRVFGQLTNGNKVWAWAYPQHRSKRNG